MDRLKFRCITDTGIYHAPSDSFSVSFHDTGISLIIWSSDGIVDEVDVNSVDQFTGLQDKNGKDVYEGDIFYYRDKSGSGRSREFGPKAVKWYSDSCSMSVMGQNANAEIEVVGNIHENPGLIEA